MNSVHRLTLCNNVSGINYLTQYQSIAVSHWLFRGSFIHYRLPPAPNSKYDNSVFKF